jgi:hypothetical protein
MHFNCVYPNPPCQLSLWEETGAPEENPRSQRRKALALSEDYATEVPIHNDY